MGISLVSQIRRIYSGVALCFTALYFSVGAQGEVLTSNDWSGWNIGSQLGGKVTKLTHKNTNDTLRGEYPKAQGGTYVWVVKKLDHLNTNEIYIEFWAKMPGSKQGLKFLKIFGSNDSGYSNTTMATDYTGVDHGSIFALAFGDGSTPGNDTSQLIKFDGSDPRWIGRSYGSAIIKTPQMKRFASTDWGTDWHYFKFHVKYNSGNSAANEVADGEYYVEIDGKVYVDAKGLFNRHYSNLPIDRISLYDWAQSGTSAFDLWYRDVTISTSGFSDIEPAMSSPPNPPGVIEVGYTQ